MTSRSKGRATSAAFAPSCSTCIRRRSEVRAPSPACACGTPADGATEVFWLIPGRSKRLADGSLLSLAGIETRPGILLQRRHAPGDPWALLASILLAIGLAMMWRRFFPSRRVEAEVEDQR